MLVKIWTNSDAMYGCDVVDHYIIIIINSESNNYVT